jgi:hypothetical protein
MKSRLKDSLVRGRCAGLLALASLLAAPLSHAGTPQTITFEPFENRTYGFGTVRVNARASSGLPVRYTSLTPDICTTSPTYEGLGFAVPTYLKWGLFSSFQQDRKETCTIAADQDGDTITNAASREVRSLMVALPSQSIQIVGPGNRFSTMPVALWSVGQRFEAFFAVRLVDGVIAVGDLAPTLSISTPAICKRAPGNPISTGLPVPRVVETVNFVFTGAPGLCAYTLSSEGAESIDMAFPVIDRTSKLESTQPVAITAAQFGLSAQIISANAIPSTATVRFVEKGVLSAPPNFKELCTSPVINGRATCDVSKAQLDPPLVQRIYTAIYSDENPNTHSEATLVQRFSPITLGVSPQQTISGAPVRLLANLSPNATGTVTFAKDGVPLASCGAVPIIAGTTFKTAACFTTASTSAARYTATYAGTTMEVGVNVASVVAPDRTNHYWGGDAQNGWGLVVTQHGETPFVTLYIYDAQGKPDWLVMSGTWDNAKAQFTGDLFRPRGGQYSNYSAAKFEAGKSVGTASLVFQNYAGNQIVDLTYTLDGQNGAKAVSKLSISGPAGGPAGDLSDIWWNPTENGWGVSITHQNNAIFAVWFTYGTDGKPVWFPLPGGTWNGNTYTGKLYRTTSSPWVGVPYDASKLKATEVGTMSFKFLDGNTADMTYTVDGVTQTKTITRQPY